MSAVPDSRAADVHAAFRTGPPQAPERPIAVVHGNCQAEALRRLLPAEDLLTVRMPPVHELVAGDVPVLRRWLAQATALIAQPVRRGYRELPIGTADVIAAAPAGVRVVLVPVIRFGGLYPEQAIVRPPGDSAAVPPLIAYHSLRTLAAAAGRRLARLRPGAVRIIARRSRAELARREQAHGTVSVSDLFARPAFDQMRTINHPGDPVMIELAQRVAAALALPSPVPTPARPLLDAVHGPRDPAVIEAFGLAEAPVLDWAVDGVAVDPDTVARAHLAWYASRPQTVAAGLARHREALDAIGWR